MVGEAGPNRAQIAVMELHQTSVLMQEKKKDPILTARRTRLNTK